MMDCYQKAADWLHWVLVFTFSTKKDHMRFIFKIVVLILVICLVLVVVVVSFGSALQNKYCSIMAPDPSTPQKGLVPN